MRERNDGKGVEGVEGVERVEGVEKRGAVE